MGKGECILDGHTTWIIFHGCSLNHELVRWQQYQLATHGMYTTWAHPATLGDGLFSSIVRPIIDQFLN